MKKTMNKILFAGDLFIENFPITISPQITKLLKLSDFSVANLEGPIVKNGCKHPKAGPNLRQSPALLNIIKSLDIKYLGVANNHIIDFGKKGIANTKQVLKSEAIEITGAGTKLSEINKHMRLGKTNVVILPVCEEEFAVGYKKGWGVNSIYQDKVTKEIQQLSKRGYFVVIFAHGGGEKIPLPSKYILKRYRQFIEKGADLVVGHHPHNVQGFERYNGKMVFYSLGNFIHTRCDTSLGALLEIETDGKLLKSYRFIPIRYENKKLTILKKTTVFKKFITLENNVINNPPLFDSVYQEQVVDMFKSYYRTYFKGLFGSYLGIKNYIGSKTRLMIYGDKSKSTKESYDMGLLLHLLRNKSHLGYITEALEVLTGEAKNKRTRESAKCYKELKRFINKY